MLGIRVSVFVDVFPLDGENLFPHSEWLKLRQEVDNCLVDRTVKGLVSEVFDGYKQRFCIYFKCDGTSKLP